MGFELMTDEELDWCIAYADTLSRYGDRGRGGANSYLARYSRSAPRLLRENKVLREALRLIVDISRPHYTKQYVLDRAADRVEEEERK